MTHLDEKALELVERLEKRAKEDEEYAENNRVVADLLSPELSKFNDRDEAGWNTYAVRMAVDHRSSMKRDSRYAADLHEAASTLTTLSTRNAELEREVKRLREAVGLLETANSLRRNSSSDVVYEDYYDGPKVEDLEDQAHTLSTSPQGGEHGE